MRLLVGLVGFLDGSREVAQAECLGTDWARVEPALAFLVERGDDAVVSAEARFEDVASHDDGEAATVGQDDRVVLHLGLERLEHRRHMLFGHCITGKRAFPVGNERTFPWDTDDQST